MPRNSRSGPVLIMAATSALGLGGLAYYVQSSPEVRTVPKEERRASPPEPESARRPERTSERPTRRPRREDPVYAVRLVNDRLTLVALSEAPPEGIGPEVFALDRTMRNLGMDGIRILGVRRQGRTATVDFNAAVEGTMGSMEEAEFVEAIRRTLGQFTGIRKIRFTVEGKPADSFGHGDESGELTPLRPGEKDEAPAEEPTDAPAPAAESESPRPTQPR